MRASATHHGRGAPPSSVHSAVSTGAGKTLRLTRPGDASIKAPDARRSCVTAAGPSRFGEAISNRLVELAALSDEPGRLTRLYLSPAHRRAADLVAIGCAKPGCRCGSIRWPASSAAIEARDAGTATLLLGSHIDSVRNAGRFDGALGVVTAIEVVKAAFKSGKRFPFAIEVIAFGDEEGVRFATTLGGSRALAGTFDEKALDELDETACRAARR